ncbi:MAG TPA: PIN domain-containing protein [Gemmataceae bacterium]|jgi:predicted nucleic acid-binding protein
MRIYCDSAILIYYFEGVPSFKARATSRMAVLWAAGDIMAISDLVRLECRMQPIRLGNASQLADYDNLFSQPNVLRIPITTAVFDRATVIRAKHNFKLADALHLAAAVEAGCDRFLTNDGRLSAFTDIAVELLP